MVEINIPEVLAEVTAVFERYEAALVANDGTDAGWRVVSAHVSTIAG